MAEQTKKILVEQRLIDIIIKRTSVDSLQDFQERICAEITACSDVHQLNDVVENISDEMYLTMFVKSLDKK